MRFAPHTIDIENDQKVRVLLYPAFERLLSVLQSAQEQDAGLAPAAQLILRPLRQLDEGFRLSEAVLGDDQIAMHHMRLFLAANSDWESLFDAMVDTLDDEVDLNHYNTGLIHEGAMIALAIAVHRVAKMFRLSGALKIPFGVAIACGVGEALVRLGPDALRGSHLGPLLRSLTLDQGVDGLTRLLTGLVSDQAERARWKLLHIVYKAVSQSLFSQTCLDGVREVWDSAWAGDENSAIDAVRPIDADPEHMVCFHIVPGDTFDFNRAIFASPKQWESRFVSQRQDDNKKGPFWWEPSKNDLHVKVPKTATWGWVGLTRVKKDDDDNEIDEFREATNKFRGRLHELLTVNAGAVPFPFNIPPQDGDAPPVAEVFRRNPVPIQLLPKEVDHSIPPFLGPNRFHGGLPRVSYLELVEPHDAGATASWDTAGADRVVVERILTPEDTAETLDDNGKQCDTLAVDAWWNGEVRVRVTPFRNALKGEPAEARLHVGAEPANQTVVLFRPALFTPDNVRHQVGPETMQRLRNRGLLVMDGLPRISDELAVTAGPISDAQDSRAAVMLDSLRRTALVSPGGESALWVAVLPDIATIHGGSDHSDPGYGNPGWHYWTPATAAFAVAVTTESHIEELVRELLRAGWPRDVPAARRCLRILGTVSGARLHLESAREELRPLARGTMAAGSLGSGDGGHAGSNASYEWHLFDAHGHRVAMLPATISHARSPSLVSALVPVDLNTHAVELRRIHAGHSIGLRTIHRPAGVPSIEFEDLHYNSAKETWTASWTYSHTKACMPRLVLELSRQVVGDQSTVLIWTEAVRLPPCVSEVALPMQRIGSFHSARISACDGWNEAHADLEDGDPQTNNAAAAIRRLDDGRIATEWNGALQWELNDEPLSQTNSADPTDGPVINAPVEGLLRLKWGEQSNGTWHELGTDTMRITRKYP